MAFEHTEGYLEASESSDSTFSPLEMSEREDDDDLNLAASQKRGSISSRIPYVQCTSGRMAGFCMALFLFSSCAVRLSLFQSRPEPPRNSAPFRLPRFDSRRQTSPQHRIRPPILLLLKSPDFFLESVRHWLLEADAKCDITLDRRHHVECDQSLIYLPVGVKKSSSNPSVTLTWMGSASFSSPASEAFLTDTHATDKLGPETLQNIRAVATVYFTNQNSLTTIHFAHDMSGASNWELACSHMTTDQCLTIAKQNLTAVGRKEYDVTLGQAKHDDHPFSSPV